MNRLARASLGCWAVLAAVGCQALPEIAAGVCGNAVIESGETCDGFGRGDVECRPPGEPGECQLDCSPSVDGSRPACPAGWGCDERGVCREATGGYRPFGTAVPGNAAKLIAADFDGDGRADVLSEEPPGEVGATKFRVHYFDPAGRLASTWLSSRTVVSVAVANVSDDAGSDVVFTDARIGVLLGQADRTLISETYPTYFLREAGLRIAGPMHSTPVADSGPLLVFADDAGELAVTHPDENTESLVQIARQPGKIADLAGEPVIGDVFSAESDDPCLDTVLAVRGQHEARVYSVCEPSDEPGSVRWRAEARVRSVPLQPSAAIDSGPLLGDLDGDGHLDLLLGSADRAYVAFGTGSGLGPAEPLTVLMDGVEGSLPMPLAAADWNGDGRADLVDGAGFAISTAAGGRTLSYYTNAPSLGSPWTTARIVDLNADDRLDVIAASDSKLDIDFFNGTGGDALNPFVIPTQRPVRQLAVGDFDGDLIRDLAYTQRIAEGQPGELMVAFGALAGPPDLQLTAARVQDIQQIGALNYAPGAVADLFLAYDQADPQGERGAALAWLHAFDRSLTCMVELTTFASDGRIALNPALGVVLGSFRERGRHDALLVAMNLNAEADSVTLWSLDDLGARNSQPRLLGWPFEMKPLSSSETPFELQLLMAAGDLDADGIDELVLAAASADGEACRLTTARLVADGIEQRGTAFQLALPCSRSGQLAAVDLDGDGAAEVVLLGAGQGDARHLVVLWNDGSGELSSEPSDLALSGDVPQAFAAYRPTPDARQRLAYVTRDRLRLLELAPQSRDFRERGEVAGLELTRATGVDAGDLDGDGIADLVLADDGNLRLLRAELAP